MKHFKTLLAYFEYMELPRPEHPPLSALVAAEDIFLPFLRESSTPITHAVYSLSLKKLVSGELNYGGTKLDLNNGAMFFMAPRQVLQWEETAVFEQKGFSIYFHEDFIKGTELAQQIKKYGFFCLKNKNF